MAMKYLLLLGAAYVGGVLRHPHEGVIHVDEADAEQPLADKLAEDVTADFDALDTSDDAPQQFSAAAGGGNANEPAALENPHQAEILPDVPGAAGTDSVPAQEAPPVDAAPAPEAKPSRRKAAASKE